MTVDNVISCYDLETVMMSSPINKEINLKKQLLKTKKAIKEKLLALKIGANERDETFKIVYKPLLDPLKEIAAVQQNNSSKLIPKNEDEEMIKKEIKHEYYDVDVDDNEDVENKSLYESFVQQDNTQQHDVIQDYLNKFHPEQRKYLWNLIFDHKKEFDLTTGIRYDNTENVWKIGSSNVELDEADVIIEGRRYKGTHGLYELLFKKNPKNYKWDDAMNYRDILISSNALHRNFNPNERLQGFRSHKYVKIIKPMLVNTNAPVSTASMAKKLMEKGGRGYSDQQMEVKRENKLDYVYWNDINELVDRLYLLHASKNAGNTSHDNEIISIEEELREAAIIA